MNAYLIGTIYKNKTLIGYRIYAIDQSGRKQFDMTPAVLKNAITKQPASFKNIELVNGELKGVNGAIDRYGIIEISLDEKQSRVNRNTITIINEVVDKKDNRLGFYCVDTSGNLGTVKVENVKNLGNQPFQNARVIEKTSGNPVVAAISGGYDRIVLKDPAAVAKFTGKPVGQAQRQVQGQTQGQVTTNRQLQTTVAQAAQQKPEPQQVAKPQQATKPQQAANKPVSIPQDQLDKVDIFKVITELKKFECYDTQSMRNVVVSVERNKKASDIQKKMLTNKLLQWRRQGEPLKEESSEEAAVTPQKVEQIEKPAEETEKQVEITEKASDIPADDVHGHSQNNNETEQIVDNTEISNLNPPENPAVNIKPETPDVNIKPEVKPVQPVKAIDAAQLIQNVAETGSNQTQTTVTKAVQLDRPGGKKRSSKQVSNKPQVIQPEVQSVYDEIDRIESANAAEFDSDPHHYYYELMDDGELSVTRYIGNSRYIKIPSEAVYNGKKCKVQAVKSLQQDPGTVVLGSNIKEIFIGAFKQLYITTIDMKDSKVKFIPREGFNYCTQLVNVRLNEGIERIHEQAFARTKIKYIKIPQTCGTVAREAFYNCENLSHVDHNLLSIQGKAFNLCKNLAEFDFTGVQQIGSNAFEYTGLTEVVIPGQVNTIGQQAFRNIKTLKKVDIQDGVETIRDDAFYSMYEDTKIQVTVAKSVRNVSANAFRNIREQQGSVYVYTGSAAYNNCIAFGIPYVTLDKADRSNSAGAVITQGMFGTDPLQNIADALDENLSDIQTMDVDPDTSKYFAKPQELTPEGFKFFKMQVPDAVQDQNKQQHLFRCYVNYLMKVSDAYTNPITAKAIKYYTGCNIETDTMYFDGYNGAYRITTKLKDGSGQGKFIAITEGNKIVYVTDCTRVTDVDIGRGRNRDVQIPIDGYLAVGDHLGEYQTIAGRTANGMLKTSNLGMGQELFKRLLQYGIRIHGDKQADSYIWIPTDYTGIKVHSEKKFTCDENGYEFQESENWRRSDLVKNYVSILAIMEDEDMFDEITSNMKTYQYTQKPFYDNINVMDDSLMDNMISKSNQIAEVKRDYIWNIQHKLIQSGITEFRDNPEKLTDDTLMALTKSYFMVSKPVSWISTTGKKSLNNTNNYNIGDYKVAEYKSNMVVKFRNPYMNGCKGAYVFVIKDEDDNIVNVQASTMNLSMICEKLYQYAGGLETWQKDKNSVIGFYNHSKHYRIQDVSRVCKVAPLSYYNTYVWDYMSSKDWINYQENGDKDCIVNRTTYASSDERYLFIGVDKQTGIPYVYAKTYVDRIEHQYKKTYLRGATRDLLTLSFVPVCIPLFPIGNMDRVLQFADKSNKDDYQMIKAVDQIYCLLRAIVNDIQGDIYDRDAVIERYNNDKDYLMDIANKLAVCVEIGETNIETYKDLFNFKMYVPDPKRYEQNPDSEQALTDERNKLDIQSLLVYMIGATPHGDLADRQHPELLKVADAQVYDTGEDAQSGTSKKRKRRSKKSGDFDDIDLQDLDAELEALEDGSGEDEEDATLDFDSLNDQDADETEDSSDSAVSEQNSDDKDDDDIDLDELDKELEELDF